jgi:hypothetical protein
LTGVINRNNVAALRGFTSSKHQGVTLPFYKTPTFLVCAILLIITFVLLRPIGKRSSPYTALPGDKRTLIQLAKNPETKEVLRTALHWDFGFIPVYVGFISLLCYIGGRFADESDLVPLRVTSIIIFIVIVGSAIDICENVALLRIIDGSRDTTVEHVAELATRLKLIIPVSGSLYGLVLLVWGAIRLFRH